LRGKREKKKERGVEDTIIIRSAKKGGKGEAGKKKAEVSPSGQRGEKKKK